MLKKFDKQYIIDNKGCYSLEDVEKLSFINKKVITINDVLKSEIEIKDKEWFLVKKCNLSDKEKTDLAYELAYAVLPIFESKNPNDKRVRECLEAIQLFNDGKINKEELRKKRAAAAACASGYVADAASYVADAVVCAAACAAANANYVAANAYAAACAAANAYAAAKLIQKIRNKLSKKKSYNEILVNIMIKFCKNVK